MKNLNLYFLVSAMAFIGAVAHAESDPCETAAYKFAVKTQHESYTKAEWKKEQPGDPDVVLEEKKTNGFEVWSASYIVDDECSEGFDILMRRSNDGESCAAIKQVSASKRDCG